MICRRGRDDAVEGVETTRSVHHHPHLSSPDSEEEEEEKKQTGMAEAEEGSKKHKWGYQLNTSSDSCISAINAYYHQVLSYGRGISVILEAAAHDPHCVLANTLSAHFLHLTDHSRAQFHLHAAQSRLEEATSYEKAIFDVIHCLMKEDRDDDVAIQIHFKSIDTDKVISQLRMRYINGEYVLNVKSGVPLPSESSSHSAKLNDILAAQHSLQMDIKTLMQKVDQLQQQCTILPQLTDAVQTLDHNVNTVLSLFECP